MKLVKKHLSFGSFGKAVSEEKIFLEINQSETRIVCGGHVCYWIGRSISKTAFPLKLLGQMI
jgi:hypothetical protein